MSLFRDLHELQGGRCGMCGEVDQMVEDHDHNTGLIRGLLCRSCNTLEGQHRIDRDHLPEACPVCLWRATPAVAWLGRTERYEGWYRSAESEFRDAPFVASRQRAEMARDRLRQVTDLFARMGATA